MDKKELEVILKLLQEDKVYRNETTHDYMGGFSQYKQQLSQKSGGLSTLCLQKNRLRFKFENIAINIKQTLKRLLK